MNLADAGKEIKEKLSGDEKVLESVFKIETLYKKYKFLIWAFVVAMILFFVGRVVMQNMHEAKLSEANDAFLTLQTKADDTAALSILKEKNPKLFALFSYAQAVKKEDLNALKTLSTSKNEILSDVSQYAHNTLSKQPKDSNLYKEMVLLEQAYLAIKAGKMKSAKNKLDLIAEGSELDTLASLLKHSTLKAKE